MSGPFVLDCSMTLAWFFEDESTPVAQRTLERLAEHGAIVPALWRLEVANVLAIAERKGRTSHPKSDRFLGLLSGLSIQVDEHAESRAFDHVLALCRDHAVTSYDATYLDLAIRKGLPLATLDADLKKAAKKLRVELVA